MALWINRSTEIARTIGWVTRSRRSTAAWLNRTGRGASRESKDAKTRKQGVWAYLEQASRDEVFLRWRKHKLGAMSNSRSLVYDWRQLLVLWMRNYPTELAVHSIYRTWGWWLVILRRDARRPEKKKVTGARAWWLSSWRTHRRWTHSKPSYYDVVKRVIAWRDRGNRRCPR
jgi:hypothetical protein